MNDYLFYILVACMIYVLFFNNNNNNQTLQEHFMDIDYNTNSKKQCSNSSINNGVFNYLISGKYI
jgi:hypothetical protein